MVYIEEVAIDNLIFNGALLTLTLFLLKEKRVWWRVLISAIFGAAFAVFLPFIDNLTILYKFGALVAVTMLAAKYKSFKRYLLFTLTFSAVSFSAGGAAYGLMYLLTGDGNLYAYTSAHAGAHALKHAVIASFAFLWVFTRQIVKFASRRRFTASNGVTAVLSVGGSEFSVDCFDDSGNKLVDGLTLKPVMVLSHDVGAGYVRERARTLEVATVGAVAELPLITADKLTLHTAIGDKVYEKMPIAVSDRVFDGYKLIFNSEAL